MVGLLGEAGEVLLIHTADAGELAAHRQPVAAGGDRLDAEVGVRRRIPREDGARGLVERGQLVAGREAGQAGTDEVVAVDRSAVVGVVAADVDDAVGDADADRCR